MTTIFGHRFEDLDDYELEIVIDNPAVRTWFAQNARNNHIMERYHYDGSLRGKLISLLKTASKVAGVGSAIYTSLTNLPSNTTPDTEPGNKLRKERQHIKMPSRLNLDEDEEMAQAVEMTRGMSTQTESGGRTLAVSRSIGTQASGPLGTGETPIDDQRPHYGLPDTTTVILPWTQYFTPVTFADFRMIACQFRMNSPYDCAVRVLTTPATGSNYSEGVYGVQPGQSTTWPATQTNYPTLASGTTTAEAPQWRGFYEKIYSRYTVLGAEFTLTMVNPRNNRNNDVVMAWGFDASSPNSNARVFPQERQSNEMEFWPDLNWKVIKSCSDGTEDGTFEVVKGYYRPGNAKRNTQNDEDVKTWTNVGSIPTLDERLTLFFGRAGFNGFSDKLALKCKIQIKYIVQYKDPSVNVVYPHGGQTAFALNMPTDVIALV